MSHKPHTKHDLKLLGLMILGIFLILGLVHVVFAKPVDLGKFGDYNYYYEDSSISYTDNTRAVWVGTADPRFNFGNDADYGVAVGQIALDCSGHNSALVAGIIFSTEGKVLHQRGIPDQDWAFFAIKRNTVQDELYRILCVQHAAI